MIMSLKQRKIDFKPRIKLGNNKEIWGFKDVRANCLCASLLRMQFMLQHHATSCMSVRAKEEIYSHEGMVSIALTLLRFNLLEW